MSEPRKLSPIEMLIDQATGYQPNEETQDVTHQEVEAASLRMVDALCDVLDSLPPKKQRAALEAFLKSVDETAKALLGTKSRKKARTR